MANNGLPVTHYSTCEGMAAQGQHVQRQFHPPSYLMGYGAQAKRVRGALWELRLVRTVTRPGCLLAGKRGCGP
jgi:hypothetical protein